MKPTNSTNTTPRTPVEKNQKAADRKNSNIHAIEARVYAPGSPTDCLNCRKEHTQRVMSRERGKGNVKSSFATQKMGTCIRNTCFLRILTVYPIERFYKVTITSIKITSYPFKSTLIPLYRLSLIKYCIYIVKEHFLFIYQ